MISKDTTRLPTWRGRATQPSGRASGCGRPSARWRPALTLMHGDFDGLNGVTHLEIAGTATLTSLPASPFDEMTALVRLDSPCASKA